ncbi:putative bifunctional diguanylate cyclase/phosphodiesterase [Shewanella maritima]|uniref:putative bifunctional diguanylate cyclase/phosphodiesterase n=1 Tax=Shewanella maritima TaxID=2520507 RepID=UPI003735A0F5
MSLGIVLSILAKQGVAYHSFGMYIASTLKLCAGFLQILWLLLGCFELARPQSTPFKYEKHLMYIGIALGVVLATLYAFDPDSALLRHMIRTSSRYVFGGLCFCLCGYYLFKKINKQSTGRNIVTLTFFLLGLEMLLLGLASFSREWNLIADIVRYHGAFELLAYSTIGLGLVMWLLEFEQAKQQSMRERLNVIGHQDILTGLNNREGLEQAIKRWQAGVLNNDDDALVVLFGIDNFKRINEAGGVKLGDEVLIALADFFKQMPETAIAKTRLSGDVFACVMNASIATPKQLEMLRKTMARSVAIPNHPVHIDLSLGAAKIDKHQADDVTLLNAQRALSQAKKMGGRQCHFYSDLTPEHISSISLEHELRRALKNDEFCLYLQPIYNVSANKVESFEVLVRWQHPHRGILSPVEFIPFLSQLQLMPKLDLWVLAKSIEVLEDWQKNYAFNQSIAINLSAEGLNDSQYMTSAKALLEKLGRDVNRLNIEITESSAMKSISLGQNAIASLSDLGVNISLDDFGTGYSSLNYLKSFPADKIKFDHSFIKSMTADKATENILRALVPLCQQLGKTVVAEGIETYPHLRMAQNIGFDQVQGYLFAKPMPVDEATKLLFIDKSVQANQQG